MLPGTCCLCPFVMALIVIYMLTWGKTLYGSSEQTIVTLCEEIAFDECVRFSKWTMQAQTVFCILPPFRIQYLGKETNRLHAIGSQTQENTSAGTRWSPFVSCCSSDTHAHVHSSKPKLQPCYLTLPSRPESLVWAKNCTCIERRRQTGFIFIDEGIK